MTYVCSYDYVLEFAGSREEATSTRLPKGPDIYNFPPNFANGTENAPIARYKRYCADATYIKSNIFSYLTLVTFGLSVVTFM